jgi:hypothetical protein
MRSVGLLHALAPVMDVARDARWGRVTETYGEDPHLVSAMSVAFTRGMQGKDLREGVLAGSSSTDIRSSATFTVTGKMRSINSEDRTFLPVATVGP